VSHIQAMLRVQFKLNIQIKAYKAGGYHPVPSFQIQSNLRQWPPPYNGHLSTVAIFFISADDP